VCGDIIGDNRGFIILDAKDTVCADSPDSEAWVSIVKTEAAVHPKTVSEYPWICFARTCSRAS